MIFDKVEGKVGYNDEAHVYSHIDDGTRYESVTTLISRFTPKFDGDYWATYKACKDSMEALGLFRAYKSQAGGWENVVAHYKETGKRDLLTQQIEDIEYRKQVYLDGWTEEGRIANIKGSIIHEQLEGTAHSSQEIREGDANYKVSQEGILDAQDFTLNRVYPELLIYNDKFKIAGQADKVFKEGRYVDVHDYKTYKKLEHEGFRGETLLSPLTHLQNANYWKTALQLSIYGWMLEELGYEVRKLYMHWIHGKDQYDKNRNEGVRTYELPYLKDDVIRLMMHK